MYKIDLSGQVAVITGGTRGIGLGIARALGGAGVRCVLTHRWGSRDPEEIKALFAADGSPEPLVEMADVARVEDTRALMERIKEEHGRVDHLIHNVAFAAKTPTLKDYRKRSLFRSLEYSAWPVVDYVVAIEEVFGEYPRHVVAISSDGADRSYPGYDFVAISKSVLEVLSRYLGSHLGPQGTSVNAVRFGMVATESFEAMFGESFWEFLAQEGIQKEDLLSPEECGKAVLALCSGLLDSMQSEVITVDRGMAFEDNLMRRYEKWRQDHE